MSGTACGPGCGWCGRCTAEWERPAPQPRWGEKTQAKPKPTKQEKRIA